MRVMKFGGTSVGGPEPLRQVCRLVETALADTRVVVVASALSGVTNLLVDAAAKAGEGSSTDALLEAFVERHRTARDVLAAELGNRLAEVDAGLEAIARTASDVLKGLALLGECPPSAAAQLTSLGERASCVLLGALLAARGNDPVRLDPTQLVACEGDPLEATPLPLVIRDRAKPFREGTARLALVPGFIGGDARGRAVLLGRGGSDWSAALVGAAMDARLVEIWTDVEGIYSADPRLVPEAQPLPEVTFEEAMELAHFGAKVLHPKTIAPARERGIPVRVCNTFRPEAPGTMVRPSVAATDRPVRGISFLSGIALVNVSGPGMQGVPGVAARIFGAMARRSISVVLITQASSECTVSFCVREQEADGALQALESEFEVERAAGRVDPVEVRRGLAVLSIVGEGMRRQVGVSGTFFTALGEVACNVVAIAQGSSERSISAVVDAPAAARAMRHVHHQFFRTRQRVELFVFGTGTVGRQLLKQLAENQHELEGSALELRLCGVANSSKLVVDPQGIDPLKAEERLAAEGAPYALDQLGRSVAERLPDHPVLVDCTSSKALADAYPSLLAAGLHVVTASKIANASPMPHYRSIREAARRHGRRFHYETNVGAGLPVIDTLRGLLHGGDRVIRFEGILSGSLSFLFGLMEDGVPFSQAVRQAREKGFTEPDPRDDLSGLDVARKVLILARESGLSLELADVKVSGVLPEFFDATGDVDAFMARCETLDAHFAKLAADAKGRGEVLRFVAAFGPDGCEAGVQACSADHPLSAIRGGENAFSFLTRHYRPRPLVVRGYGAGAAVTAAGVLADVVKLVPGAV